MASAFITYSYQINFESVLMIHDHEGMFNMFKALESSGLRRFLGCESVLYEKELGHFFDTALIQGDDITGAISGKHFLHSQMASSFITNSYQINFESVLMIHDNEGMLNMFKSLEASGLRRFLGCESVLYEAELGQFFDTALLQDEDITCAISGKFITISPSLFTTGVPFPSAKILSMKTVHTYIVTNTTIDARAESEEPGMAKTPKAKKKTSSADEMLVDIFAEITASKKRSATEADAPIISKKRRTRKSKPSVSQVNLDIVHVAPNVEPLQIVDPTHDVAAVPSPVLTRKSRKRRLVLSGGSDDESVGTEEIVKNADAAAVASTDEADIIIAKVLEENLELGVSATERDSQGVDEALFEEDFARWLDDFVARHNEPEFVGPHIDTQAEGSIRSVAGKEVNISAVCKQVTEDSMPIDDLLIQISDDLLLPITAVELTKIRLGEFLNFGDFQRGDLYSASLPRISSLDKGKGILVEDEQVRVNPAREIVELICTDVAFLVNLRDQIMVDVENFFHSFSINKLTNFDALLELKEKEKFMLEWAETDVKRKMYILAKYKAQMLRMIMESHRQFCIPGQHWTATASQILDLLSDAHSKSMEDLLAQQREHGLSMDQPCPSSIVDSSGNSGATLARCYSIATSTCWVRPVILVNGVWTPIQGPDFWRSSCHLSLFLNKKTVPAPAIQEIFIPHGSFIEPILYWTAVPWIIRTWQWTKVCEEVVQFSLSGGLRPVREDICHDITVFNLGVERIPADFLRLFAQGLACHSFVDSVIQRDLGDIEEVVLTDVEEVDLVSSDVSTVYRSPSPLSPGVDSLEHDLRFALGPAIFSRVEQEERLYFVQSPESAPAISPHLASSSSSTDVSMNFDSTDVRVNAHADTQASASVDFTKFTEVLEDLRSSLAQRIHDSNCEMLSNLNAVEVGVRGDLLKVKILLRQSFETACRVLERQSNNQTAQITDLKKGLMGPVGTIFGDLFDIKKKQREQDARLIAMDEQIAAIRSDHLDFQSKIAADILSLSTQVGDIADYLRGGAAKNGQMGSTSLPSVTTQTKTFPPTTGTFEERVAQARRHIIETGQVISIEEAAERVIETDRRESDRVERERERERRDRRQSRSGSYKRRRGY
ncbi:hypothetical protein F511_19206 [Dorcoceras hygrometricum]|uniref:Uncharacterized protein n=1 Tax=Dorcoceras hygrometricum TaxID=472368 RepID=A0A2Z7DA91_9LAMI|nr:hypothetical protein F511_19206 [Dorcoceras hygrometricum]